MNNDKKDTDIQQQIIDLQNQSSITGEFFRSMLHESPVAIMIVDRSGKMLYANHAFELRRSEELIGKEIYEFIPQKDHQKVRDALGYVFDTGKRSSYTITVAPKGEDKWYESYAGPVWQNNKVVAVNITTVDITEKTKIELALKESEERYRAIFNSHNLVYVTDTAGNFIDANQAVLDLSGYDREEISTLRIVDIIHPDQNLEPILQVNTELLETGIQKDEIELKLLTKHNELKILEIKSSVIKDRGLVLGVANDITALKQAEEAYRISETRYRDLINGLPIGIYEIDFLQGKVVGVNDPMCELSGYTREELFDLNPSDLLTEESQKRYFKRLEKMLNGESVPNTVEFQVMVKSGEIKDIRLNAKYLYREGNIYGANVVVEDITEQKQSEEALKKSEQRLKDIFDSMREGYYRADMEGNIIWTNRAALEMGGYTHEREIIGKNIADNFYLNPEQRTSFAEQLLSEGTSSIEVMIKKKDGQIATMKADSRLIYDQDGNPAYVDGIFWDITERKAAEAEIENTRRYLESIINSSPSIIICYDEAFKITQWNKAAEELTGLHKSEVLNQPIKDIFPHYEKYKGDFDLALTRRKPLRREKESFELNNRIYLFDLILYPLVGYGAKGVVARIDDVTERVSMEETMIQTEKMMSLGGMSAGMAHEINNPLAGILQTTQNLVRRLNPDPKRYPNVLQTNLELAEKCGVDPEKIREYLELRGAFSALDGINSAGQRVVKIIRNMLEFGRDNSSKIQPEPLHELLNKSIELARQDYDLKQHYDFKNIDLVRDFDQRLRDVPCSKSEFEQVILNLLKNSAESLNEIRDKDHVPQITLKTLRKGQIAQIKIVDNGPGMDLATQKRIFDPFFTTKDVGQGTGLGLSVSYFIIKNHHRGEIFVESVPGSGTTFTIQLPMATKQEDR